MSSLEDSIILFADGACSGNPGPGGWGTVVWIPNQGVAELGGFSPSTTNNQMELTAVCEGLERIRSNPLPVRVYTDSVYVIRGITQWVKGWERKGWKTAEGAPVANQALWERLSALVNQRPKASPTSWHYVRGHSGIPGNERVDEIAVAFTARRAIDLYNGPNAAYPVPLLKIPSDTSVPQSSSIGSPKKAPLFYLSLVGSTPMRHPDWASCERRVKGVSGAKFKKVHSEEEEKAVLNSWGVA